MKKVRFTKQQVIGILKQHQQLKTADLRVQASQQQAFIAFL